MAITKTSKAKQSGIKIEVSLLRLLKNKSKTEGRTMSWIINNILRSALISEK